MEITGQVCVEINTEVSTGTLDGLTPEAVDGGISAWVIPSDRLQGLIPSIMDHMVLPPAGF